MLRSLPILCGQRDLIVGDEVRLGGCIAVVRPFESAMHDGYYLALSPSSLPDLHRLRAAAFLAVMGAGDVRDLVQKTHVVPDVKVLWVHMPVYPDLASLTLFVNACYDRQRHVSLRERASPVPAAAAAAPEVHYSLCLSHSEAAILRHLLSGCVDGLGPCRDALDAIGGKLAGLGIDIALPGADPMFGRITMRDLAADARARSFAVGCFYESASGHLWLITSRQSTHIAGQEARVTIGATIVNRPLYHDGGIGEIHLFSADGRHRSGPGFFDRECGAYDLRVAA